MVGFLLHNIPSLRVFISSIGEDISQLVHLLVYDAVLKLLHQILPSAQSMHSFRTSIKIYVHIIVTSHGIHGSSSSSCHQTISFHRSAHCFPTSLNIIRSSKEQGCASWKHCKMCAVVSSAFPQVHVMSPVYNFQFFLCALLQVYPMRRRLRHLHVVHGLS